MSRFSSTDKLFREYILLTHTYKCEWCGKSDGTLSVSHILNKGTHQRLRYCEKNVLLLCYRCHIHRWHKSPLEAARFLMDYKGNDIYDVLRIYERTASKIDIKMLNKFFRQEIKRMEDKS